MVEDLRGRPSLVDGVPVGAPLAQPHPVTVAVAIEYHGRRRSSHCGVDDREPERSHRKRGKNEQTGSHICSSARSVAHLNLSASLATLVATSDEQSSSSRAPLPEGTIPVGIGLLVAGLASFAFLRVGKNALGGDHEFAPVLSLWFATFALAPGFFLPLEQELGRAISARRALGQGGRPVVRKVATLGVILAGLVIAVVLVTGKVITDNYFDGDWVLLLALVVAFASYAPVHLARGIASGSGRFRAYAVVMGADGQLRIVNVAEVGEDALLVHDAHREDPGLAFALARLSHDDHSATPFGVFRDVERGDYGSLVGAQLAQAFEKKGPGDLRDLLRSNGTWHVGG